MADGAVDIAEAPATDGQLGASLRLQVVDPRPDQRLPVMLGVVTRVRQVGERLRPHTEVQPSGDRSQRGTVLALLHIQQISAAVAGRVSSPAATRSSSSRACERKAGSLLSKGWVTFRSGNA